MSVTATGEILSFLREVSPVIRKQTGESVEFKPALFGGDKAKFELFKGLFFPKQGNPVIIKVKTGHKIRSNVGKPAVDAMLEDLKISDANQKRVYQRGKDELNAEEKAAREPSRAPKGTRAGQKWVNHKNEFGQPLPTGYWRWAEETKAERAEREEYEAWQENLRRAQSARNYSFEVEAPIAWKARFPHEPYPGHGSSTWWWDPAQKVWVHYTETPYYRSKYTGSAENGGGSGSGSGGGGGGGSGGGSGGGPVSPGCADCSVPLPTAGIVGETYKEKRRSFLDWARSHHPDKLPADISDSNKVKALSEFQCISNCMDLLRPSNSRRARKGRKTRKARK